METPQEALGSYLQDALRLRSAMDANIADADFVRLEGRIIYAIDANVVRLFIRPAASVHHLSVFQRWLPREVLVTTAALTAEFIFSGRLPGQRGDPIYMTPGHYDEVISTSVQIERAVNAQITALERRGLRPQPLNLSGMRRLGDTLMNPDETPSNKILAITRQLPPEVARLVEAEGEWASGIHMKRLFSGSELIRRLDSARWFDESLEPTSEHVLAWYQRLREFRSAASPPPKSLRKGGLDYPRMPVSMLKLLNDASTLAMLELLTRRSIGEQADKCRYLLITADAAIRQAVETFLLSPEGAELPDFTRHVREFAPLLNLSAIAASDPDAGRFEERREIFRTIRATLDELLLDAATRGLVAQGDVKSLLSFEGALSPHSGRSSEPEILSKIGTLKDHWSTAATIAASLAIPYLKTRNNAFFGDLSRALSDRMLVGEVLDGLRNTVAELHQLHAQMMFQGSLRRARLAAQSHAQNKRTRLRPRAPLILLDADFSAFIGTEDREMYFEKAARGEIREYPTNALLTSIGLTHLFNACLFVVVENWRLAHTHSRAALQSCRSDSTATQLLDEALYCNALTRRFTMTTADHYQSGLRTIGEVIQRARTERDLFSQARVARGWSERAALRLFALYSTYLSQQESAAPSVDHTNAIIGESELVAEFTSVIRDLHYVQRRWIESHDPHLPSVQLKRFSHRLKLQAFSNIGSAWIFKEMASRKIAFPPVSSSRAQDLMHLTQAIEEDSHEYGAESATAVQNQQLLSFIECPEPARDPARKQAITTLQNRLLSLDSMLPVDRRECEVQLERLKGGSLAG
jgi:hypothetical protein